jgi:OOP family OmpA-OmpF porin
MKWISLLVLPAALVAGVAQAQTPTYLKGGYIGGSLGQARVQGFCDGTGNADCDRTSDTWRLFGGYEFSRFFALELGYADLGRASINGAGVSANSKATAWDLSGIAAIPIGPVSLFGRLGGYYGEVRTDATAGILGFTTSGSAKETNSDITYGLGLKFNFTPNFGVRGEWQRYQHTGGGSAGEHNIDNYSIGLSYRF